MEKIESFLIMWTNTQKLIVVRQRLIKRLPRTISRQSEFQSLPEIESCYFTPVLARHSKSFSLIDCISVGVDRKQWNFEMRKQVEAWQRSELTDVTAQVVMYEAFKEGTLEAPKHLARTVHDLYLKLIRRIPTRATAGRRTDA